VLLAVLAVYLTFTATDSTDANAGHYDATSTQSVFSTTPSVPREATTVLSIPAPDHNFSNNVTFEPQGAAYTPSCNKDGPDGDSEHDYRDFNNDNVIDAGETPCAVRGNVSGQQVSDVFLGVANNACTSNLIVIHDLFMIPTPNNELDPRASSNIVHPLPEGTSNRFGRWRIGAVATGAYGDPTGGDGSTNVLDADSNTRAESGSLPFQNYPSYLLDMFDPDAAPGNNNIDGGPDSPPVVPLALYGGNTQVSGTWVPLYFAVFDKGDLNTAFAGREPHPFTRMTTAMGYPNQSILNDPTALKANASTITDFCTPLTASNTAYGGVRGAPAEAGAACANAVDDDGDLFVNDGCPTDPAETGAQCNNATNDDADTRINDGCPTIGNPETGAQCLNALDDDSDGGDGAGPLGTNDGCPTAEQSPSECVVNTADEDGDGLVNDGCPSISVPRVTNPSAAGTHLTLNYSSGLRDSDNDGFENAFDSCPKNANIDDARVTLGGDSDDFNNPAGDALDPSCDPTPSGIDSATNGGDHDNDTFPNAQDICPLVADPLQIESENAGGPPGYDTAAIDGGPATDSIGDFCDGVAQPEDQFGDQIPAIGVDPLNSQCDNAVDDPPTDGSVNDGCPAVGPAEAGAACANAVDDDGDTKVNDGCPAAGADSITVTINNKSVTVNFSSTVGNGHWHNVMSVLPKCYGGTDADGDGYCAAGTDSADSGACAGTVPPSCSVRHNAWTTTGALAAILNFDTDRGGGDNTGAGDPGGISPYIACPGGAADICPENGFDSDAQETYAGTSPAQACSADVTLNNEPLDSWVFDFNDDTRANISDITAMGPSFNKFVNAAGGTTRTDINSDGATNISDVTAFGPFFNKQCRRDDGTLFGVPQ
jgi:hypothetical protein